MSEGFKSDINSLLYITCTSILLCALISSSEHNLMPTI